MDAFSDELKDYRTSKGAIQIPLDQPIPYSLVARLVRFNVENVAIEPKK